MEEPCDYLSTLSCDERCKSLKNSLNFHASGDGASGVHIFPDLDAGTKVAQCDDRNGNKAYQPEFAPAFVKIPFNDIELGDCCGEGSFGTVYVGKWIPHDRVVAVKTLNRMDEEVRILSTLSHRNIIQFYGACCDLPNCSLVTEYAAYGSLYGFLLSPESEKLEYNQMLMWAKDVALGMNYLHEEAPIQVVHRDLKSKNVLICDDFCLKICDFGASKVFDETTVMTITGTYPWMAPELIQGLPTSELCDVYSFGVVVWELLTKEIPFKGLQGFQVAWNVVEKRERPLIPTTCPKQLSNLMKRCWQADPNQRLPFSDILVGLDQMLSDGELEKETDSFVRTKCDWITEVHEKLKDIRLRESKLEEKKKNVRQREEIMKKWADMLESELKQKSLFNFQFGTSYNCKFSETRSTTTSSRKEAVNRMMFNSGVHRLSREEKFRVGVGICSPDNTGTGMSLSRQGSSSSMESCRSMSAQSDLTYDMSKVNIDSSPMSFTDSTGSQGFLLPKVRDMQGLGRNRMKLQRQISASSEEIQYEGMKISRESTPSNSDMGNFSEWEKSTKSKTNTMNESLLMSTGGQTDSCPKSNMADRGRMLVPSADILEKAFLGMKLNLCLADDVPILAGKLYNSLEAILRDKKFIALSPANEVDCNRGHDIFDQMPRNSMSSARSAQLFSISQKLPISHPLSCAIENGDACSTVRQRAGGACTRTVETQTANLSSEMAMKDFGTQTFTKHSDTHMGHSPSIERACTDAHKSGAREYITLRISKNPPPDKIEPVSKTEDSKDLITGHAYDNDVSNQNVCNNSTQLPEQKIGIVSRPHPPRSLSWDQASPLRNGDSSIPRHIAARRLYLAGASNSAVEQQSNIYETGDFTYIIRPHKKR